jgi:hypothetical protein
MTTTDPVDARLQWLVAALQDPSELTVADIDAAYNVPPEWRDFTPEREIDFLTNGPHAASRPLAVERTARGQENDATAILAGADGKRFSVTCWTELEPPHRLTGARIVPAPPDGLDIRLALPEDGPALATLERRAPLRLGREPLTLMTFDHGDDYFAPGRLMEEVTIYVGEVEGRVVGVYCGAVQPVLVDGEPKRLFLEHHVRIDPEAPRGGVFWALCVFGRDRYARSTDSIAFYVSEDNHAVRKFVEGTPSWSVRPQRMLIPCSTDDAASASAGATAADGAAIADVLNACHTGSALYVPYTAGSLTDRLARDPAQYDWGRLVLADGAVVGVGERLLGVTKEREGDVQRTVRSLVLDHGFAPGHADDYRSLLRAVGAAEAARGATHLAVFTSATSPTYDVLAELAEEVEVFDFWAFEIPEPAALANGFYVDPVYF